MQNTELEKSIHNIYDIGIKVKELYHIIEENDGEVDDEQFSLLQFEKNEIKKVGCDLIGLTNIITSQNDMIDFEINRLEELKAKKDKQIVNIEKALMWVLLNFGEQDKKGIWRLDLDIANLSTRKNPESVVIEDESLVPNDYKKFDLIIKDLTSEQLEFFQKFFAGDIIPEEIDKIQALNIEGKTIQKVSKKELKLTLQELQNKINKINDKLFGDDMLSEEQKNELEAEKEKLPDYGAYIKEGDLNLVIK